MCWLDKKEPSWNLVMALVPPNIWDVLVEEKILWMLGGQPTNNQTIPLKKIYNASFVYAECEDDKAAV